MMDLNDMANGKRCLGDVRQLLIPQAHWETHSSSVSGADKRYGSQAVSTPIFSRLPSI